MNSLKLISFVYLIAQSKIRCDATALWETYFKHANISDQCKGISIWYLSAWKGIEQGEQYLKYNLLDEDTGELHEFNCRPDMNKIMVKNKLYPQVLIDAFEKYKYESLSI